MSAEVACTALAVTNVAVPSIVVLALMFISPSNSILIFFAVSGVPVAEAKAWLICSWVILSLALAPVMVTVNFPPSHSALTPVAVPTAVLKSTLVFSPAPEIVALNASTLPAVKSTFPLTPVVPTPIVPSNNFIPLKSVPSAIRLISSFKAETSSCNALRSTSSV